MATKPNRKRTAETPTLHTRESIAQAALELSDRIGIENVSIRKLSAELGSSPMGLYRYYSSIDEIRAAAVAIAYNEVDDKPIPGEHWEDTLRRVATSILDMHKRHASANLILYDGASNDPSLRTHTQRLYDLQTAQGIPYETLGKLWHLLDAFLRGFFVGEMLARQQATQTSDNDAEWSEIVEAIYCERSFQDGIDLIVAGIRTMAAPDPADWRTPDQPQ